VSFSESNNAFANEANHNGLLDERKTQMANVFGGNLGEMDSLAVNFDTQGGKVEELRSAVSGILVNTSWTGPAADRFRNEWETTFTTALAQLRAALADNAQVVRNRREAIALATG
jgi:uncharacterized protein YukE